MVQIFKVYESPLPSEQTMVILGFLDNLASVVFICLVRLMGKRRLYLTAGFGIFISSLVITCYGFIVMPSGIVSFDQANEVEGTNLAFIPVICLYFWNFFSNCGFMAMPWMLLSEVFPFK